MHPAALSHCILVGLETRSTWHAEQTDLLVQTNSAQWSSLWESAQDESV